jgi:hypothetical protein
MATSIGKNGVMKVSTTTVAELRNYRLNTAADTVDDTVMGDTWKTNKVTFLSWEVSGSVFWDPADAGQNLLTVGQQVTVNLYPNLTAPNTYKQGLCSIISFENSGDKEGMNEGSFSATGSGALSTLTV